MTRYSIFLLGAIALLSSCKKQVETSPISTITLENQLAIDRVQEVVRIPKENVLASLDTIIHDGQLPVLVDSTGVVIPQQWEDTDGDGKWDELLTALDFKANESLEITLEVLGATEVPSFTMHTDVHFGIGKAKPVANEVPLYTRQGDPREKDSLFFQMEGPAWENDKVGFRNYFDPRNGVDIFGKTTSKMALSKAGLTTNYHELADWGMDILKVGNSLGSGAIALKHNDTLSRITGVENTEFHLIKEGPIQAVFELVHKGHKIGGQTLDITNRISIAKGQWGYKSEVSFSGLAANSHLVSGIVNFKPNEMSAKLVDDYNVVLSYGEQSENKDKLGMAILTPSSHYIGQENAPKEGDGIVKTYLVTMKASNTAPTSYYFLSGWQLSDPAFQTKAGFEQMVATTAKRLSHPIIVK